jgi:hypothetical protein
MREQRIRKSELVVVPAIDSAEIAIDDLRQ